MSTISLRLPESLHQAARTLAEKENTSINQLVTLALAEKVSALLTADHLEKRAQRGSKRKFRRALSKVANTPPHERDRI